MDLPCRTLGDVVFFALEVLHMLGNDGQNRRNPREVPAHSQKNLARMSQEVSKWLVNGFISQSIPCRSRL